MRRFVLFAALVALVGLRPAPGAAQVNCVEAGGSVICSDGRTFIRSGSSLIDPRGNIFQEYGEQGTRQIYGTTPESGVPAAPPTGNILNRPGETCVQFGGQAYCTPVGK